MALWKQPSEKTWYQISADGKLLGVFEDSKQIQSEIKRLDKLKGIVVKEATYEALRKFNAKTVIPARITLKMQEEYARRKKIVKIYNPYIKKPTPW